MERYRCPNAPGYPVCLSGNLPLTFLCSHVGDYSFYPVCLSAKIYNIGYNFRMVSDRVFTFHTCIPWIKTYVFGTKVNVIFQDQILISHLNKNKQKKKNIGHNFWFVSDWAFIFKMYILCGKIFFFFFFWLPRSRSNFKVNLFFKWPLRGHSCFTNTSCFPSFFHFFLRTRVDSR